MTLNVTDPGGGPRSFPITLDSDSYERIALGDSPMSTGRAQTSRGAKPAGLMKSTATRDSTSVQSAPVVPALAPKNARLADQASASSIVARTARTNILADKPRVLQARTVRRVCLNHGSPTSREREMTREIPNAIELFAGSGGLMLGLEMAGFQTLVANEIHSDPCKTLRRNFPHVPVIEGSISEVSRDALIEAGGRREVDLVAGGPPCQGFSTAGLKDPVDPRNSLIGEFVRIVREVQPRFFLMENVTGLKTLHDGRLFANVLSEFDSLGYSFQYGIVHAADFGVPQMRKRLIIIGARDEELPEFPIPRFRSPKDATLFTSDLPTFRTCGDALGDIPAIAAGEICTEYEQPPRSEYQRLMRSGSDRLFNHQTSKHRPETIAYYSLVPPGGTWLDIPPEKRKKKQGMQRWPTGGLARTVTSEPTDFLHPTLDRIPTIRELARIQSFPDRFEFIGQRTTGNKMRRLGYCAQSQQVGNAVPPLLAQAIGESFYFAATERKATQPSLAA